MGKSSRTISTRQPSKRETKSYQTVDYSKFIGVGFKVLGVLALLGTVWCLWLAKPRREPEDKRLIGETMQLLTGVHDALYYLKKPVKDSDAAFEVLFNIASCKQCDGTGLITNAQGEEVPCPACTGVGVSRQQGAEGTIFRQALINPASCQVCMGQGKMNYAVCSACQGKGYDRDKVAQILKDLEGKTIRDAYGMAIKIEVEDLGKKSLYTIISAGRDRRFGTKDDLKVGGAEEAAK